MPKPKPRLESEVQKDILKWLNDLPHVWAWRRNIGAFQIRGQWVRFGQKGMADIEGIITIPGRELGLHLEVETKRPGNKPTPDQRAWLAACATSGAIAVWADSVPVLEEKLKQAFRRFDLEWPE